MVIQNHLSRYTNLVFRKTVYCGQQLQHTTLYTTVYLLYRECKFKYLLAQFPGGYVVHYLRKQMGCPTKKLAYF